MFLGQVIAGADATLFGQEEYKEDAGAEEGGDVGTEKLQGSFGAAGVALDAFVAEYSAAAAGPEAGGGAGGARGGGGASARAGEVISSCYFIFFKCACFHILYKNGVDE